MNIFPPPPPPPTVNFAVGIVCRLSVCSGIGTSGLEYFGVDLAKIWYMGHGCRVVSAEWGLVGLIFGYAALLAYFLLLLFFLLLL